MYGVALVGSMLVLYSLSDSESMTSYTEFVRDYLERDLVKRITIAREGSSSKTTAYVYTSDNTSIKLVLGNVDHFLENLERYQLEKGRTPD